MTVPQQSPSSRGVQRAAGWMAAALGGILAAAAWALVIAVAAALTGLAVLLVLRLWGLVLMPIVVMLYLSRRPHRHRLAQWHVLRLVERGLRLGRRIAGLESLTTSRYQQQLLRQIGSDQRAGHPLHVSLASRLRLLPLEVRDACRATSDADLVAVLTPLLAAADRDAAEAGDRLGAGRPHVSLAYLDLFTAALLLLGIGLVILPKYLEIYADFGVAMPAATVALFDVLRWMWGSALPPELGGHPHPPGVLLLLVILLLSLAAWLLVPRVEILRRAARRVVRLIPGVGGAVRDAEAAALARVLAASGGQPPDDVRRTGVHRRRLRAFSRGIDDPAAPPPEAALPEHLALAVATAHSREQFTAAAGFAAELYESRLHRSRALIAGTLPILLTLFCGALCGFIAYALFLPLVVLIKDVT